MEGLDVPAIRRAWSRSTSSVPDEWAPSNPARGQCCVTALVIQDLVGGVLGRVVATMPDGREESHYLNVLDGEGVMVDLTEQQFPEGTVFTEVEARTREYVLSFPDTLERYQTLRRRIEEIYVLDRLAAS